MYRAKAALPASGMINRPVQRLCVGRCQNPVARISPLRSAAFPPRP